MRAALYLRVSTDEQTVDNQRQALQDVATARGWPVVKVFADEGISGAKGRDKRPGFDGMLKASVRREYDILMCWSVDRLGRNLGDLVNMLRELEGSGVSLYLHTQAIDTSTPAGKAFFQMAGVFAEFERAMIQARIRAGIERRRRSGLPIGKRRLGHEKDITVRKARIAVRDAALAVLRSGGSINAAIRASGLGSGTVQRLKASLAT